MHGRPSVFTSQVRSLFFFLITSRVTYTRCINPAITEHIFIGGSATFVDYLSGSYSSLVFDSPLETMPYLSARHEN
ncbi:hypothetical protein HZ326_2261 [Fusarium oxysporum f. sp. albedinis]|nr:hypothetical protein HZ326_2261 [Fusarium oxysporum f. sp. albedinis]